PQMTTDRASVPFAVDVSRRRVAAGEVRTVAGTGNGTPPHPTRRDRGGGGAAAPASGPPGTAPAPSGGAVARPPDPGGRAPLAAKGVPHRVPPRPPPPT